MEIQFIFSSVKFTFHELQHLHENNLFLLTACDTSAFFNKGKAEATKIFER